MGKKMINAFATCECIAFSHIFFRFALLSSLDILIESIENFRSALAAWEANWKFSHDTERRRKVSSNSRPMANWIILPFFHSFGTAANASVWAMGRCLCVEAKRDDRILFAFTLRLSTSNAHASKIGHGCYLSIKWINNQISLHPHPTHLSCSHQHSVCDRKSINLNCELKWKCLNQPTILSLNEINAITFLICLFKIFRFDCCRFCDSRMEKIVRNQDTTTA